MTFQRLLVELAVIMEMFTATAKVMSASELTLLLQLFERIVYLTFTTEEPGFPFLTCCIFVEMRIKCLQG